MARIFFLMLIIIPGMLMAQQKRPAHHSDDGFVNPWPGYENHGLAQVARWMLWDRLVKGSRREDSDSVRFDAGQNDPAFLRANRDALTVTWVGHATLLLQIDGLNILTDPIWSERASPVSFAGPKRLMPPGIDFKELPEIDAVLISHNHYDHLDTETLKKLAAQNDHITFFVPLGLGAFLEDLDIQRYEELDWWQSVRLNGREFIATPTQHFSGRTLWDRDETLWCSWVVIGAKNRFYYAGDTGYFPGFKEIGQRYGPFTLAAIPIGAYRPRWFMSPVHVSPVEAVQAYLDLGARYFIPIHWGTFVLADEPLREPPRLLMETVARRKLNPENFRLLKHGETFIPGKER